MSTVDRVDRRFEISLRIGSTTLRLIPMRTRIRALAFVAKWVNAVGMNVATICVLNRCRILLWLNLAWLLVAHGRVWAFRSPGDQWTALCSLGLTRWKQIAELGEVFVDFLDYVIFVSLVLKSLMRCYHRGWYRFRPLADVITYFRPHVLQVDLKLSIADKLQRWI